MSASRALLLAPGGTPLCKNCSLSRVNTVTLLVQRRPRSALRLPTVHRSYSSGKRTNTPWTSEGGKRGIGSSSLDVNRSATPIPKSIVAYLDEYVIGQDSAKRAIAVGVFNHYMRAALNRNSTQDDSRHWYMFPPKKTRAKKVGSVAKNADQEESILSDFVGQTRGSKRWSDEESQIQTDIAKDSNQSHSLSPTYFSSLRPSETVGQHSGTPSDRLTRSQGRVTVTSPSHRKNSSEPQPTQLDKSNMILIGPSGSGKTHLIRTLSTSLSVPFVHVDATPLTSAGYVGEDVESIMSRLLEAANWNVEEAEKGIVCIDEVDKLASPSSSSSPGSIKTAGRDVGGTGVQQALLRILEGSIVSIADKRSSSGGGGMNTSTSLQGSGGNPAGRVGRGGNAESKPWWSPEMQSLNAEQQSKVAHAPVKTGGHSTAEAALLEGRKKGGLTSSSDGTGTIRIDTSKVLFVLSGAFVGLQDILAARGATSLEDVEAEDLTMFGLIPEFVGRLPVMVTLKDLTEKELERILTEPRNALVSQYQTLFASFDIKLHFTTPAIASLAHQAAQSSTTSSGARMLRRLLEKRLMDAMYDGPGGGARYALMDQSAAQGLSQVQLFSRGGRSAWLNAIEEDEEKHRKSTSKSVIKGKKTTSTSSAPLPATSSSSVKDDSAMMKIQTRSGSPSKAFLDRIDEASLRRRARARLTRPSRVGNLRILTQ